MNRLSDYDYHLPDELIAQFPPKVRGTSRLLIAENGGIEDRTFPDFIHYLRKDDLLIFNNTRVIPARIYGQKESGGKVEIMLERLLTEESALAQLRVSKAPKVGHKIVINGEPRLEVTDRNEQFFTLSTLNGERLSDLLDQYGKMPLPPYITREDETLDEERYQTVFGHEKGAVAAPTAGLHFTEELLQSIDQLGVHRAEVTLHVGAGTFQPIRTDNIDEHTMHQEWISVPQETIDKIEKTRQNGGRVIAIGTTVVRALESMGLASGDQLEPFEGDTNIFIKPNFTFRVIDGLLTNFHLPQSTLLVLVSTLMGKERIEAIYQHAIEERYRFFSYGDAMLLLP